MNSTFDITNIYLTAIFVSLHLFFLISLSENPEGVSQKV